MSSSVKGKSRLCAAADKVIHSVNERILRECHELYTEERKGLVYIAEDVGIHLLAPRKKITILLIGNHSAGKSTFINWYVEEHVQRTGVAIETQGFTIVTSGKKRESLTGNATMHLYPHLQPLQEVGGVMDYIGTEITTSKQKKFSLVMFIDTPGLVDGDMKYPFDVNKAILWLGEHIADRVFVFFDPIGQALCKRTLNIVEKLSENHADIMKFYLSKADEAGHENDRQRVMMQIVQELCKRPGLNRTGFDMPTIYVPTIGKQSRCSNQIEDVCKEIEKTINSTIQSTLNTLERDCSDIATKIDVMIEEDDRSRSHNLRAKGKGFLFGSFAFLLPLAFFANSIVARLDDEKLTSTFGAGIAGYLKSGTAPISAMWSAVPGDYYWHFVAFCMLLNLILFIIAHVIAKTFPTMSRKRKRTLLERRDYVQNHVKKRKEALYKEYLQQSVTAYEL